MDRCSGFESTFARRGSTETPPLAFGKGAASARDPPTPAYQSKNFATVITAPVFPDDHPVGLRLAHQARRHVDPKSFFRRKAARDDSVHGEHFARGHEIVGRPGAHASPAPGGPHRLCNEQNRTQAPARPATLPSTSGVEVVSAMASTAMVWGCLGFCRRLSERDLLILTTPVLAPLDLVRSDNADKWSVCCISWHYGPWRTQASTKRSRRRCWRILEFCVGGG